MAKRTTVAEVVAAAEKEIPSETRVPIDAGLLVSTGSTLLDLAISGGRVRGGGIPGGIMVELYGPSSSGKTALLVEIGASCQAKGGDVRIADPEARLDKEYTRIYGLSIDDKHYSRPDTVTEMFDDIINWTPENEQVINMYAADSIAALSTNMEMSEDGDKRGQRKAKELSEGCRKTARLIAQNNKLVVFTNQERDGERGKTTPGGFAVPYHASLRIRVARTNRIEKEKKMENGKIIKKTIGIQSDCLIKKSSVDDEYRVAPIYIIFGIGIDDVRANLQYLKDMEKGTKYLAVDKEYASLDRAIDYIEVNNFEGQLREMVINVWTAAEKLFQNFRKEKVRF